MKESRRVQAVIIKRYHNTWQVLLLHRTKKQGGFWQNVTGAVESAESFKKALKREVAEETGITQKDIKNNIKIFRYQFILQKVEENVFLVEVDQNIKVDISNNPVKEHDRFKWVTLNKANNLVKFDTNKIALYLTEEFLKNRGN